MSETDKIKYLESMSWQLRIDALETIYWANSWHLGSCFSIAEIMSVLYFNELNIDPQNPGWADRDRFIMSKGHASAIWYAALAERGFFPKEELATYRRIGSKLQGHPDMKKVKGLDMTTGSLGNGLGLGAGMAITAKMDLRNYRVYVLLGDGEIDEGAVWEAAMFASHNKLDNLTAIIDCNRFQIDGTTKAVLNLEPLDRKWEDFGFATMVIDGHNVAEIMAAFEKAKQNKKAPACIIANTIKGKGVSFLADTRESHWMKLNAEQYELALQELRGAFNE
ncbi:MAG: transketolase [Bacillota bacterium]|jgi:transketolase